MDLTKIPTDPFEARYTIQSDSITTIALDTIKYIQNNFKKKDLLYSCIDFMNYDFIETSRSDFETLQRVWLFPTREAAAELNESLNRVTNSLYKAVYDNLRRALEITIVGSYFSQKNVDAAHAREWLNSERETPPFSRAIKSLLQDKRVIELERDTLWITKLKNFYWDLSDIIHVRGEKYSLNALQPTMLSFNCIDAPYLSSENLDKCLDTFIYTFQNICTTIAITNPILLIGLPIEEKYGINPPMSGFFTEYQSNLLWQLLIPDTKSFFDELIKNDKEIISLADYFNNLPDITEQEFDKQISDFKIFMEEMKKGSN